MLCPNCEAENRDDAKFCDECGFPLSGAIARGAGAASPSAASSMPRRHADVARESAPRQDDLDASPSEAMEFEESFQVEPDDAEAAIAHDEPEPDEPPRPEEDPSATVVIGQKPVEASDEGAGADDPFAGYSTSIDDDGLGFADASSLDSGYVPVQGEWQTEFTMQMPRVDQAPRQAARNFRVSDGSSGRARRRIPIIIAAGVVAGVIVAAVVTYLLGFWGGIAVPDVTGMTESDARAALEQEGFSVRSTQVKSDDTEGLVLIMDPTGGSRAGEGSEVVIHISTARFVPEVVGRSEDDARELLEDSGYENVSYEKEKSEGEEGIVLSISPEAGTRAKSNAQIVVKVSEAYRVPDISGLDLNAAEQAVVDSGLVPGVVYVDTDQYEDGTVLGTDPEAGTKVDPESYVSINVARKRGAELVSLTESMFAQGETVTIGGVDYEVQSLDSVAFEGDDVVSFTITGLPKTTFFGKTIYADEQVVSGQVAWSEDNEVLSIS